MGTPARVGIMLPGTLFCFLNPHIEKRQRFLLRPHLLNDVDHTIDGLLNVIVVSLSATASAPRVCTFTAIVLYSFLPGRFGRNH